jgi:hypothetical protein
VSAVDLFTDTPREALIDTDRRVGDREPHVEGPGGAAPASPSLAHARICSTCGDWAEGKFGFGRCTHLEAWRQTSYRAACTFLPERWVPISAETLARRAAQAGIDQAVEAADREITGWSDVALRYVRLYATQHRGAQFIGHDIVQASVAAGVIQPSNSKAWGAPIQRAARAGYIKRVGYAPDPNRHTNPVPLWEAA